MIITTFVQFVQSSCSYVDTVGIYLSSTLGLNIGLLIVGISQAKLAFSGTVKNHHPRRFLGFF